MFFKLLKDSKLQKQCILRQIRSIIGFQVDKGPLGYLLNPLSHENKANRSLYAKKYAEKALLFSHGIADPIYFNSGSLLSFSSSRTFIKENAFLPLSLVFLKLESQPGIFGLDLIEFNF